MGSWRAPYTQSWPRGLQEGALLHHPGQCPAVLRPGAPGKEAPWRAGGKQYATPSIQQLARLHVWGREKGAGALLANSHRVKPQFLLFGQETAGNRPANLPGAGACCLQGSSCTQVHELLQPRSGGQLPYCSNACASDFCFLLVSIFILTQNISKAMQREKQRICTCRVANLVPAALNSSIPQVSAWVWTL